MKLSLLILNLGKKIIALVIEFLCNRVYNHLQKGFWGMF